MHAGQDDVMAPERAGAPRTVVYTTLYDLIAAVDAEVEPGEEACVAPIVAHLLRAVVYLCAADKYRRLTHRLFKDQKGP